MIRDVSEQDFDELQKIYMHPDVNRYLSFDIIPKREFKPIFEELKDSGKMLVSEENGKIVATCIVQQRKRRSAHVAQISTFAVHPEMHSHGVGSKFFTQVLDQIKQNPEIRRIELSVESDNLEAIRFYKKLGFEIEGTLKKWFKRDNQDQYIDEHIMGLWLR